MTESDGSAQVVGNIAVGLLAVPMSARAQQPAKIPRVGYVSGTGSATDQGPYVEAIRRGLRDLGQIEGRTFSIEYRGAEGKLDRVPSIIDELVQLKVDVICRSYHSSDSRGKQATKTIPIVIVTGLDPVANGTVDSLARPAETLRRHDTDPRSNRSIRVDRLANLNAKRLELLKEVVPQLSRVAVLWTPDDSVVTTYFKEYEAAARALKLQLQSLQVRREDPDVDEAFQSAANARADALITITTASLFLRQKRIADLAVKNRLPTMFPGSAWVESGGLMSYSTNDIEAFRLAGTYVDRILKGARPADLPVEQLAIFELAINLVTAKAIGVANPHSLLLRADKVFH